jgi:hypothetical protein
VELTIENASYDRFFDEILSTDETPKHFHYELSFDADEKSDIKFLLGRVSENVPDVHNVLISNLRWRTADETQGAGIYGDVNSDGVCDITDLSYVSLYLLGDIDLDENGRKAADVSTDGEIDLSDLAKLKRYLLRK